MWDGDQIQYEIQAQGGGVSATALEIDKTYGNHYGRVLYTHGPGIDAPLDIIRMRHMPPAGYGFHAWGGPYPVVPFGDWRGTFVGGTTAQGVKLPCDATYCLVAWPGKRYRAFLERDRPVHQQNFFGSLTTGQENSNGLMYMRNRYYNPLTGAFTQTGPIGLAGGLNTYGYAEGNPVTYSDPYGLKVCARSSSMRRHIENTYQVIVEWDKSGCVDDSDKVTARAGSGNYAELQEQFNAAVDHSRTTWVVWANWFDRKVMGGSNAVARQRLWGTAELRSADGKHAAGTA